MLVTLLYRHWLELRFMVLATMAPWIGLCALTGLVVVLSPQASPIAVHAWTLSIGAVAAGLAFGGSGVRGGLESGYRPFYYTLTLPVSRFTLGWTRLCAGAGVAFVFVAGTSIAIVAALWLAGRQVPWLPMAVSTLLGIAVAVSTQAVAGLVVPLVSERFSPALMSLIPFGVMIEIGRTANDRSTGWMQVVGFIEFDPARWDVLVLVLLSVPASLATALVLMRTRDF